MLRLYSNNGAFSFWRSKRKTDWDAYYRFVENWKGHPGFDWALIPDVIEGDAAANDKLLKCWPTSLPGVPVWHLHEPVERLVRLAHSYTRVALGSSAEYAVVGTPRWFNRMYRALWAICDVNGVPITKLHGLRMLDGKIVRLFPFSSADSTNIARNIKIDSAWKGTYQPYNKAARGVVLAERIESQQSAPALVLPPDLHVCASPQCLYCQYA